MAPGPSSWLGRRRQTEVATQAGELTFGGERIPPLRRGLPKWVGIITVFVPTLVRGIRRCVVHYIAPDGQVYPFCS